VWEGGRGGRGRGGGVGMNVLYTGQYNLQKTAVHVCILLDTN